MQLLGCSRKVSSSVLVLAMRLSCFACAAVLSIPSASAEPLTASAEAAVCD